MSKSWGQSRGLIHPRYIFEGQSNQNITFHSEELYRHFSVFWSQFLAVKLSYNRLHFRGTIHRLRPADMLIRPRFHKLSFSASDNSLNPVAKVQSVKVALVLLSQPPFPSPHIPLIFNTNHLTNPPPPHRQNHQIQLERSLYTHRTP